MTSSTGIKALTRLVVFTSEKKKVQLQEILCAGDECPVKDLRNRLEDTCQIARESLNDALKVYKHHYDKSARDRILKKGDKELVHVLLSTTHNKLRFQWKGQYGVTDVVNKMDYRVNMGSNTGTYHINMLKKYEKRDEIVAGAVIIEPDECPEIGVVDDENLLNLLNLNGTETYKDVQINPDISSDKQLQLKSLVKEYQDIFTEKPGTTNLEAHTVQLTTKEPVRVKQYPMPYSNSGDVNEEGQTMLKLGIFEPATSDYNSPIVLVRKKDNTNRFCIDFRRLNSITIFDTEPMSSDEDIRSKLLLKA